MFIARTMEMTPRHHFHGYKVEVAPECLFIAIAVEMVPWCLFIATAMGNETDMQNVKGTHDFHSKRPLPRKLAKTSEFC